MLPPLVLDLGGASVASSKPRPEQEANVAPLKPGCALELTHVRHLEITAEKKRFQTSREHAGAGTLALEMFLHSQ